ncbi:Asp-tRNA(Asn)/Glu-tRNA(Gln) amidotransferase subunit GatA [Prochlorococcus sp. MIT 1223]|uniref:Asp-tRNA(Asn)/Glu-tRNA(Gln) amidotransferase subunit GatA n=1 Tax=Prochlorococcus sp. MIT 1223 TaxID=3096217 RepID=UPI002A754F1E|nr:Asp-tRNA(Asn)/Glu-tRNA(Gln) amidotransferase subunit GatA [Prochlorococcus sp. MIT 1223]
MSISDWRKQLNEGNVSAVELVKEYIDKIQLNDDRIHSYLTLNFDQALAQAEKIDNDRIAGNELPPLAGVPFGIKDNLCTKGIKTTCSSRMLEGFIPPYESTVTNKLWKAGGILLGKTNLDEFAMGSSTENSAFGNTFNPWDISRVPGGSSGGSAAAVASGMCMSALGSDTGGSIRQPASFCGVVGLKPTYGRVSRWGLVAFASSLDQVGPLTSSVSDSAEILQVIAGADSKDSTCLKASVPNYAKELCKPIRGLKVGLIKQCFDQPGLSLDVKNATMKAAKDLEELGVELIEVDCPCFNEGIATYYVIAPSEASANLARYDGVKYGYRSNEEQNISSMTSFTRSEGFGNEVKRRILIGTYALSAGYVDAYYKKAQKVRTLIRRDFESAFNKVDLLLTPTSPTTAFKAGSHTNDPLSMYLSDLLTIPANLAGLPAISLPSGFDSNGLPIGLQFIGNVLDEAKLLQVAYQYEQTANVMKNKPDSDFIS